MRGEELFKYLVCCTLSNLEQVPAALAAIMKGSVLQDLI